MKTTFLHFVLCFVVSSHVMAHAVGRPTPACLVRRADCIVCGLVSMEGTNAVLLVREQLKGEGLVPRQLLVAGGTSMGESTVTPKFLPDFFTSVSNNPVLVLGRRVGDGSIEVGPWSIWPDGAKNPRWNVPIRTFEEAKQTVGAFLRIYSVSGKEERFVDTVLIAFDNPSLRWIAIAAMVELATSGSDAEWRNNARHVLSILAAKSLALQEISEAEYQAYLSGTSLLPRSISFRLLQRCMIESGAFSDLARSRLYYGFARSSATAPALSSNWTFSRADMADAIDEWKRHDANEALSLFDDSSESIRKNAGFVVAAVLELENNGSKRPQTKDEWSDLADRLLQRSPCSKH